MCFRPARTPILLRHSKVVGVVPMLARQTLPATCQQNYTFLSPPTPANEPTGTHARTREPGHGLCMRESCVYLSARQHFPVTTRALHAQPARRPDSFARLRPATNRRSLLARNLSPAILLPESPLAAVGQLLRHTLLRCQAPLA